MVSVDLETTVDPVRNESRDWLDEFFNLKRCQKMSDIPSFVELWESRIRKYEKLVYQTEKIQAKVPDSCRVFIVCSLVPRDLEKDLLKVHATANYKATKEYILEQASLKEECSL